MKYTIPTLLLASLFMLTPTVSLARDGETSTESTSSPVETPSPEVKSTSQPLSTSPSPSPTEKSSDHLSLKEDKQVEASKQASEAALASYKAARADQKLTSLKELGHKLIDERDEHLTSLKAIIAKDQHLSDSDRQTVNALIDKTLAKLHDDDGQIDTATSLDGAKTKVKTAVESQKVYSVVLPQTKGLVATNRLKNNITALQAKQPAIDQYVQGLSQRGVNTTAILTALASYKTALDKTKASTETARTMFQQATDKAGIDAARAQLETARTDMLAALQSLKTAAQAAKTAVKAAKTSPSPTVSASTSPTSTASLAPTLPSPSPTL